MNYVNLTFNPTQTTQSLSVPFRYAKLNRFVGTGGGYQTFLPNIVMVKPSGLGFWVKLLQGEVVDFGVVQNSGTIELFGANDVANLVGVEIQLVCSLLPIPSDNLGATSIFSSILSSINGNAPLRPDLSRISSVSRNGLTATVLQKAVTVKNTDPANTLLITSGLATTSVLTELLKGESVRLQTCQLIYVLSLAGNTTFRAAIEGQWI